MLINLVVEQEIRGLEALEYETARKLELLRESRDAAKFNSTWKGRTLNAVGYLFAIYCVVRVFNVSRHGTIHALLLTSVSVTGKYCAPKPTPCLFLNKLP